MVRLKFVLVSMAVTLSIVSPGQTLYNHDSKITLAPNASLTVRGEVDNQGTIVNNGHLKVSGAWLNSGTYVAGVGQVTFNSQSSTVPQIIHHNGQTFGKLSISGGNRKIILSDLTVEREMYFDDGIVEAAGSSKIVFSPKAGIFGASDRSHVHGVVYQQGSGHKLFPIGNGLMYLPVELPEVSDPSAVIGVQAFEFENLSLSKGSALESISTRRYWHISVQSGLLPQSPIILPLGDESWSAETEKVVVVEARSPDEAFTSIGRSLFAGENENGRIRSEFNISAPFVSLAREAVESDLIVHNAVSSNPDGLNDYVRIQSIENYPENKFTVFNRWGDKVFEIENYNNDQNVFRGWSNFNGHSELVSGSYFYVLELPGRESLKGFIAVKN